MADSRYPEFPDGIHPKQNDFLNLQAQVTALTNALATLVSSGVVSGFTLSGEAPTASGSTWDYKASSVVSIGPGVAIAVDGSILIVEDTLTISNTDFYNQATPHNVYIYQDSIATMMQRNDVLGRPQPTLVKPHYTATTTNPGVQKQFTLCAGPIAAPGDTTIDFPGLNYSGRVWTHTGELNGVCYSGPMLDNTALVDGAILLRHMSDLSVGTDQLIDLAVTTAKIGTAAVTPIKIASAIGGAATSGLVGIDQTQIRPDLSLVPVATILTYAGIFATSGVPTGWLPCDGSIYLRTDYPRLAAVIGTAYQTSTTRTDVPPGGVWTNYFRVPDLRGMFLRGVDKMTSDGTAAGVDPGRILGNMQDDGVKTHTHPFAHRASKNNITAGTSFTPYEDFEPTDSSTSANSANAVGADETRPKNIAISYIIKY